MASGAAATGQATMSASALKDFHTVRHSSGLGCDERLEAAIESLRKAEKTAWIVAAYSGVEQLTLRAEGESGFLGLASHLEDTSVAYCGLVGLVAGQRKAIFLSWVGDAVGGMLR